MNECGYIPGTHYIQNMWWPEFGLQDVVCGLLSLYINFKFGIQKIFLSAYFFLPGISKINFKCSAPPPIIYSMKSLEEAGLH